MSTVREHALRRWLRTIADHPSDCRYCGLAGSNPRICVQMMQHLAARALESEP